jgi:very-short-patch-repair endonuclease
MDKYIPPGYGALLEAQSGIIARRQAPADGATMRNRVKDGRWQRPYRAVYAAFSGELDREARLWAALRRAGEGATLSHQTAAERHRLIDEPRPGDPAPTIHITVPATRRPAQLAKIPGVVIHRSHTIFRTRHPVMAPPCTRVEDTVLDLIETTQSFDEAYNWICRAIGRRRTTAARIRATMDERTRMRWRKDLELALGDAGEGVLSLLEYRYVRYVERAHGLPTAKRQQRIQQRTGNRYLDNLYEEYRVCVELDGAAAHPPDEQWRDKRRDNWNLVHEDVLTLRFGFLDLRDERRRCETAHDVATRLTRSGWPHFPHPCPGPGCALRPVS